MKTLRQWASFNGRISRKTFAIRYVFSFLLDIIFSLLVLDRLSPDTLTHANFDVNMLIVVPLLICMIITTIVTWATVNKRFHDIGKSSKWTWGMIFVGISFSKVAAIGPIIAVGFFLYLLCKKGTNGDNEYGPDPLQKLSSQQLVEINAGIEPLHEDSNNTLDESKDGDVAEADSVVAPVIEEESGVTPEKETFETEDDSSKTYLKNPHQRVVLTIDDLPKLKNMFDSGVITQEEFDSAKKKILGQ